MCPVSAQARYILTLDRNEHGKVKAHSQAEVCLWKETIVSLGRLEQLSRGHPKGKEQFRHSTEEQPPVRSIVTFSRLQKLGRTAKLSQHK